MDIFHAISSVLSNPAGQGVAAISVAIGVAIDRSIAPLIKSWERALIDNFFKRLKEDKEKTIASIKDPEWQHIVREMADKIQKDGSAVVKQTVTSISDSIESQAEKIPVIGDTVKDIVNEAEQTINENITSAQVAG